MATISHEPATLRKPTLSWLDAVDMWSTIAIVSIWVAVIFTACFAPGMHFSNGSGLQTTDIPSVVPVALFAIFASGGIAKYGYGRRTA